MLAMMDAVAYEAMLFAAVGLLIGGLDDLGIDLLFLLRRFWRRRAPRWTIDRVAPPAGTGTMVVFVPAWDEAAVIGGMLRAALARFDHPAYRIHVGVYPNDAATIAAAGAAAAGDPRVRLVVGPNPGPTTKADCLNHLWHDLLREEAAGLAVRAVVFHDAEDVVHPDELRVFDALIDSHAVVQLPVLPLMKPGARLIGGHYGDEFAEAHVKQMVVRTALGAGMPLAGTGCAVAPAMLRRIAAGRGGDPFDADSLVEDYELGLRIAALGGRAIFARVADRGGATVAVRAYFPDTIDAAVRQKARWMTGIALAGWDRTGWARVTAWSDHWMRARDRRAPLAVLVLAAAYLALVTWSATATAHWATASHPVDMAGGIVALLVGNGVLLAWRTGMRMAVTGHVYGWREACWSVPRLVVGNYVALLAARRAVWRYVAMLRGAATSWEKTCHQFPDAEAFGGAELPAR